MLCFNSSGFGVWSLGFGGGGATTKGLHDKLESIRMSRASGSIYGMEGFGFSGLISNQAEAESGETKL